MLECFRQKDVEWYLNNRNNKYLSRETFVNIDYSYFNEWLSGFIEAEGCFSIRKNKTQSFSIGQNDDKYIIEAIKLYFNIQNSIRNPYKTFWFIETYRKSNLQNILNHFKNYPLLGQKNFSFMKFKDLIQ